MFKPSIESIMKSFTRTLTSLESLVEACEKEKEVIDKKITKREDKSFKIVDRLGEKAEDFDCSIGIKMINAEEKAEAAKAKIDAKLNKKLNKVEGKTNRAVEKMARVEKTTTKELLKLAEERDDAKAEIAAAKKVIANLKGLFS